MAKLHVKKDDTVVVITGKDKGQEGQNHGRGSGQGQSHRLGRQHDYASSESQESDRTGWYHPQRKGAIAASNVMLFCSKCDKGVRTGVKVLENGSKVRVCKKCGEVLDK